MAMQMDTELAEMKDEWEQKVKDAKKDKEYTDENN